MLSSVKDWSMEASCRREGGGGVGEEEGGGGGKKGGEGIVVLERTSEGGVGMKKMDQKKCRTK